MRARGQKKPPVGWTVRGLISMFFCGGVRAEFFLDQLILSFTVYVPFSFQSMVLLNAQVSPCGWRSLVRL